ncbi:MAG: glycosyltransferase [Sphaerochaeta sp.]|nr:glycosyltransferase [Sphaerochaeta sp.]
MNILFLYSRDIDITDSGGSRTTILLANYISSIKNDTCYCLFKILAGKSEKVIELERNKDIVKDVIKYVNEYMIDVLYVPEAYYFADELKKIRQQVNCKIISALHNKPGYEKIGNKTTLLESLRYNPKWIKRVRAAILLTIFPIFNSLYVHSIHRKFRTAFRASDKFVLLSSRFFIDFSSIYKIKNTNKLCAIGNPLSFTHFASGKEILEKQKTILVVSRLEESQKKLSYVFFMWQRIQDCYPDWSLIIVGDGRSKPYYSELIQKRGLRRIEFAGRQDPRSYYLKASIFLLTSAYEGWGMTITEAQQYGCVPVVMNSFSSVYDLIDTGENGVLTTNDDLDEFTRAVQKLIDNDAYRIKLAKQAVISSKRFLPEIIYSQWSNLFHEALYP